MQKKKNIAFPSTTQHHDTPNNKTYFIKFRVTEIEKLELEHTAKLLNLSLSTLIRRALHNVKIEKKIIVASSGEETLTAVSTLPSAARWAATSTSLQSTSILVVRTPSRYEQKSLTNLQI